MITEPGTLGNAVTAFLDNLHGMIDEDSELSDIHDAFEKYCMGYSRIGDDVESLRTGSKGDRGIDFYSRNNASFVIGQCKIPDEKYFKNNPCKRKLLGQQGPNDTKNGLDYLLGDGKGQANERVKLLRLEIQRAKKEDADFRLKVYFFGFGALNTRAKQVISNMEQEYENNPSISIISKDIDSILDAYLLNISESKNTDIKLRSKDAILSGHDYCYFLCNAADIVQNYIAKGWQLFDLNVRFVIKNSPVNDKIIESISHQKSRKVFHHYNNGITITCNNFSVNKNDNVISISAAQIINGLQTVVSLHKSVVDADVDIDELDKQCKVQVKVIKNTDVDFLERIVLATNNQNPMEARNLKSNLTEQRALSKAFSDHKPRWYYQRKQGEWYSLTTIQSHLFKDVAGHPKTEYEYNSGSKKKIARLIDNKDIAFSWLSFIGFSDEADKRTKDHFRENKVYDIAFRKRPTNEYWKKFSISTERIVGRENQLEDMQASVEEYLLAYFLFTFVKKYIKSIPVAKREALDRGVKKSKLTKASGAITSTQSDQQAYLSDDIEYQTLRIMSNMKSVLIESIAFILSKRYGPLTNQTCTQLFSFPESREYLKTGCIEDSVNVARESTDLGDDLIFGRTLGLLKSTTTQFFEEKRNAILAADRIRYVLLSDDMVQAFKEMIIVRDGRTALDTAWKKEGTTFFDSLPDLPEL